MQISTRPRLRSRTGSLFRPNFVPNRAHTTLFALLDDVTRNHRSAHALPLGTPAISFAHVGEEETSLTD